jgi:hypothetical protein
MPKKADKPSKPAAKKSPARSKRAADAEAAASALRCYNIPDYRLEQPEFSIAVERDSETGETKYSVEGDLSADPSPIRDSKIPLAQTVHRDLSVDAAEPQDGSGSRVALQAEQGRRRSVLRLKCITYTRPA